MQTNYQLTPQGLKYVIASDKKSSRREALLFILGQYSDTPVSFENIKNFHHGDKIKTFKQICDLLDAQLLKLHEKDIDITIPKKPSLEQAFVMSDMNGLIVSYHDFTPNQAQQISVDAVDLMRVSRRNRNTERTVPLSIETEWHDTTITTYHLFLNRFNLLLTCKTKNIFSQTSLTPFISYFCNRYNYE